MLQAKLSAENIIKTVPEPTRMAVTHVTDIRSTFELVMPDSIQKIILEMTNLEGKRVFGENWKDLDKTHLDTYLHILDASLLGSISRRMNRQPVCGMQRQTCVCMFSAK